jgi:hypothetical protein
MYPTNLTTNEVKIAAGTEIEFLRQQSGGGTIPLQFGASGAAPNRDHTLKVQHQKTGSGANEVRRSLLRFDKEVTGASGNVVTVSAYAVMVIPVGDLSDYTEPKNVLAELMSNLASLGASTTILYDCTGYGADALINGTY